MASFHSQVSVDRQVLVPMRDGVNLTADVYRPKGVDTPLPVLLMRLPYGRAIASTVTYKHPSWYALQGYIVVIQDVRGCGTSAGEFYPFRHEYADGFDTVQWCVQELAGSNGKVGMYGFSYQGVTQFQAAVMQPQGLVTICPAMATADFYHGWFYFGGAIALEFTLGWALQLTQNQAYFHKLEPQATKIFQAQKNLDYWLNHIPLDQCEVLKQEPLGQFFFDWICHQQESDCYWQELNPASRFADFNLPALHIAGWADIFIEATLNTYTKAKQHTSQFQKLIVAPWQHMPWQRQVGEIDFGGSAVSKIDEIQIDWFNYWLKGIDNGLVQQPPVQVFLMGEHRWLGCPEFGGNYGGIPILVNFYLGDRQQLSQELPQQESLPDIYIYDPRIPNPSTAYGAYDQRGVHQRSDMLLYVSDVLTENLRIIGTPEFHLYAATSAPDTDWVVKLLDIYPDGKQMLVTMGVLRAKFRKSWHEPEFISSEAVLEYVIKLRPTCHSFLAGHCVGVAIASAAFPLIERHTNTQKLPSSAKVSEFFEATQQIYHSLESPSHLALPIIDTAICNDL